MPFNWPTRIVDDAVPQQILQWAAKVNAPGFGFDLVPDEEKRRRDQIAEWASMVRIASAPSDALFPDMELHLPLWGLTREKAQILNVLNGYPVRFWREFARPGDRGYEEGELGVFLRIILEGERGTVFDRAYDIKIATSWHEEESGPSCGQGTMQVMGVGALKRLEVLALDPWDMCHQCGCWRPRECLRPAYTYFEDDEDRRLNEGTMECRNQSYEGYCR